jgi:hypothetical protein
VRFPSSHGGDYELQICILGLYNQATLSHQWSIVQHCHRPNNKEHNKVEGNQEKIVAYANGLVITKIRQKKCKEDWK